MTARRALEAFKQHCRTEVCGFRAAKRHVCVTFSRGDLARAVTLKESMFHLIWYILIGLISGVIAKSVMHEHMTTFWTIVFGIIGSIIGGGVTHMFSRATNERYHPAGLIF
jgi:uncharacterized membrane protein YeaQ/YmgE (transglycosylase-associated protein family)